MAEPAGKGLLVVVSGPSGCGKSTLCRHLVRRNGYVLSVSATTRSPRPGEAEGRDYFFLDREEFLRRVAAGGFLEYSEHFGHLYGTPRGPVEEHLARGEVVLLEIDVNGGRQVREATLAKGRVVLIFVTAPDIQALRRRLMGRDGTHPGEPALEERLARVEDELAMKPYYDHVVVNDDLDGAVARMESIIEQEVRSRDGRRPS